MTRRIAFAIPIVVALFALDFWLWVRSNGVDCYPACSPYQDSLRWFGWLLAASVAVLVGTLAVLTVRAALRGRPDGGRA